ncbi:MULTISPECIES: alpha/beta fold hydrolase [unclassified Rathayibacter]|uniref:alpha/beta fold hydrolase n=1 Tax=unclassified Rathayibacter TaxID=2609250 RepID=UPI00188B9666|nr:MULTISPECIES: alpha/beta hydrolase [unclassified Rathayibacter]MBF4463240.1 alpha/beta hydrolase [Rathayibacter sp. VKM Ac-2879]MBF4504523.1 alpha/beta hydrolase [Rathayibacter sp. VKM Ac-2878]
MPTIASGSSSIFYQEFGDAAAPPLVLIHGLFSDSTSVASLATALSARFRVIAPDMIGHGRSSRTELFTLADQGRAVNDLTAALGYESSAIVGISMGSYVAAQATILDPARTFRLVLVVPKGHGKTSSVAAYAERQGIDLRTVAPEDLPSLMADALWSPSTSQERRDEILSASAANQIVLTPGEQAAVERSLAGFDLRPELPTITAPTLIISGRADGLNPPTAGEEIAHLVPDATFTIYANAGHMLAGEEPNRLAADVTAFIDSPSTFTVSTYTDQELS